jgi:hypothetical protein
MEVRMVNTSSAGRNNEPVHCFMAIELSKSNWVVGFQTPLTDRTSRHQVKAGDAKAGIACWTKLEITPPSISNHLCYST